MKDGIDRRAFTAELRALDTVEHKRRAREFGSWMNMAARSQGWRAHLGLLLLVAGLIITLTSVFAHIELRPLILVGVALILIGHLISLYAARRARQWRARHPFEEWRRASEGR